MNTTDARPILTRIPALVAVAAAFLFLACSSDDGSTAEGADADVAGEDTGVDSAESDGSSNDDSGIDVDPGVGTDGFEFVEADPEAVGMDSEILDGAREYAFEPGRNTQAVVVVREGTIIAEWYAEDRDATSLGASWSVGKSVASAIVGIALERGEIPSVDEPMTTYVPEWEGTERAPITLRDVLEMASGLAWVEDYDPSNTDESDVAQMVLDTDGSQLAIVVDNPVRHEPGTTFNYSSGDAMLLSQVIEVATGTSAGDYAQEHLFAPMGIDGARWFEDLSGDTLTYCCLDMTARDFARFGQLFLEGGELGGNRIVPEAWAEESTSPSRSYEGYGYQWWLTGRTEEGLPADTFSALGHDGQYVHIVPSLDLVVVRLGMYWPHEGDAVADPSLFAVYPSEGLFPGLGTAPPDSWSTAEFMAPILESIDP